MIALNIAQITETEPERAARLKREARAAAELPRIEKFMREEHIRRYPNSPEARKARREKEDKDFMESIKLDSNLPKVTVLDTLQPGWKGWQPLGKAEADRKAAEEKAWRDAHDVIEIIPTPDPETR